MWYAVSALPIIRCLTSYIGAGNAIFPLLAQNRNPDLRIHAFDYSSHAVKLVQVPLILGCLRPHQSVNFDRPSTTLCTNPRLAEQSRPRSGTSPQPSLLQVSRRALPTFSSSYLFSAPYTLPNGPAPSPI